MKITTLAIVVVLGVVTSIVSGRRLGEMEHPAVVETTKKTTNRKKATKKNQKEKTKGLKPKGTLHRQLSFTIDPSCSVSEPTYLGDGECDGDEYNVTECAWDGGDCIKKAVIGYPNCFVFSPEYIKDGMCDYGEEYNTFLCGWDGTDCIDPT